ncbi:unnamed protein product, partial [Timema podura]|nr:unnamed protein product [Timema podura]
MSAKAISEATGKDLINRHVERLVVKPDQLIKRRGKLGLIKVNVDLNSVKEWISARIGKNQQIGKASGKLRKFIVEPFIPHNDMEPGIAVEHLIAMKKFMYAFIPIAMQIPFYFTIKEVLILEMLMPRLLKWMYMLAKLYNLLKLKMINPLVVKNEQIYILDLAVKLDSTADFICRQKWGEIEYPPPFGRDAFPEEAYIADLDAKSGASLK